MKKCLLFCFMFLCFNINVYASDKIEVKIKKCVDGDTAWFKTKDGIKKYRFLGIDAPEVDEAFKLFYDWLKEDKKFSWHKSEFYCYGTSDKNFLIFDIQ